MLKQGQQLEKEHHIVRHVPPNKVLRDENGNVLGFYYSAFQITEDNPELSCSWLEFFNEQSGQPIEECVRSMRKARKINSGSGFGIANVGELKQIAMNSFQRSIRVVFTPNEKNPSHTEIKQLPIDDIKFSERLALEFSKKLMMNQSIT